MSSFLNSIISDIPSFLMRIPIVLLSLSVHESAHAWAAYKMGDPTARNLGRISLNPLKHLDPIGAVCMLLFRFGWARPVPIRAQNFKNPRRGMALSSVAGPISNLILAIMGLIVSHGISTMYYYFPLVQSEQGVYIISLFYVFFQLLAWMNISLAVFNLIPIPPLDGSRLANLILPDKWYFKIMQYERYIYYGIIFLLFTGILTTPLSYAVEAVYDGVDWLICRIPFVV